MYQRVEAAIMKTTFAVFLAQVAHYSHVAMGHEPSSYGMMNTDEASSPSLSYANITSLLDTIQARGHLRVGTTGDYKPFSYKLTNTTTALPPLNNTNNNNNGTSTFNTTYIGADIDMAQALSNALRLPSPPVFIPSIWSNLTSDILAHKFDIAMGGISITLARAATGAFFSTPVLRVGKTGCIRCSDTSRFPDLASLDASNVKIATNPGGTNEAFDRAEFQLAEIVLVEDNNAVYQAVVEGRADAMVSDRTEVELQVNLHNGSLCTVNEVPWTFEEVGYLLPRGDAVWKHFVDVWVRYQVESGMWNETLGRWMEYRWPVV